MTRAGEGVGPAGAPKAGDSSSGATNAIMEVARAGQSDVAAGHGLEDERVEGRARPTEIPVVTETLQAVRVAGPAPATTILGRRPGPDSTTCGIVRWRPVAESCKHSVPPRCRCGGGCLSSTYPGAWLVLMSRFLNVTWRSRKGSRRCGYRLGLRAWVMRVDSRDWLPAS